MIDFQLNKSCSLNLFIHTHVAERMNAVRNYSLDAITALAEGIASAAIAAALKEIDP